MVYVNVSYVSSVNINNLKHHYSLLTPGLARTGLNKVYVINVIGAVHQATYGRMLVA